MAAFVAGEIKDDETVSVGASLPVCRAGILLAHLTHAPNLKVQMSFTMTNLRNVEVLESFEFITDWRAARWAEFFYNHDIGPDLYKRRRRAIFFIGGLQIDAYGNTNLIGIGSDFHRLKMRGPGGVGTASMGTNIGRYYLYVNNHNKQTLTERLDWRSSFGFGEGGADARKKLQPARRRPALLHHAAVHLRFRGADQADAAAVRAPRRHGRSGGGEYRLHAGDPGHGRDDAGADRGAGAAPAQSHRRGGDAAAGVNSNARSRGKRMDSDLRELSDRACIVGVGQTDYSKASGRSVQMLALQAARAAIADAGLKPSDIDAILPYVLGPTSDEMAAQLGIADLRYSSIIKMGGATFVACLETAALLIHSGIARNVLVFCARNGRSGTRVTGRVNTIPGQSFRRDFESPYGFSVPGQWYAMIARRHMIEFGTSADGRRIFRRGHAQARQPQSRTR